MKRGGDRREFFYVELSREEGRLVFSWLCSPGAGDPVLNVTNAHAECLLAWIAPGSAIDTATIEALAMSWWTR